MTAKKIWANLGVAQIERTTKFYLALGFEQNGDATKDLVSFLFGEDKFVIHFFSKRKVGNKPRGARGQPSAGQ